MNHQVVFFSAFFYNDSTFLFKIFSHKNENHEPELIFLWDSVKWVLVLQKLFESIAMFGKVLVVP